MSIEKRERILERQKLSYKGIYYNVQRIDLLIISISGAGVFACLQTLKFLFENEIPADPIIKIAGVAFLFAIIVNFISQLLGSKSNYYDYLMCDSDLDVYEGGANTDKHKADSAEYDEKSQSYTVLTDRFNYVSSGLMLLSRVSVCCN